MHTHTSPLCFSSAVPETVFNHHHNSKDAEAQIVLGTMYLYLNAVECLAIALLATVGVTQASASAWLFYIAKECPKGTNDHCSLYKLTAI